MSLLLPFAASGANRALSSSVTGESTVCDHAAQYYQNKGCCGADSDNVATCVSPDVSEKLDSLIQHGSWTADTDVTIKSSSLSYMNAAGRVGFNYSAYYNDFTNEGHMYPVHGVGDLDKTSELMAKFIKSAQGQAFTNTDLGISIQVTDESLTNENCFFDFHTIPTKMLDGSAKLPDGSRIESHIPYFSGVDADTALADPCRAAINWIDGSATFIDLATCQGAQGTSTLPASLPTTLSSTRATPFLKDYENLALTFFQDGKQSRLNNGGRVSNWRYVIPYAQGEPIAWFVAKAWRPCQGGGGCTEITTTDGKTVSVQPRVASETEDLNSIANEPRYMQTVSKSVSINAATRAAAFNQRYTNKAVNFGDVQMKDTVGPHPAGDYEAVYNKHADDKQIAFNELLAVFKADALTNYRPYTALSTGTDGTSQTEKANAFIAAYCNTELYNISPQALATKAMLPKSYMQSNIGETGWLVVDDELELEVPDDDGEYLIGWVIDTQSVFDKTAFDSQIERSLVPREKLQWLTANGYALHQGPGLIYETCGKYAHVGTQEPYLLEHNYAAVQNYAASESYADFKLRKKSQEPRVHWRLDAPSVIKKSLEMGAVTEANVGAGQMALVSIGTQTPKGTPSRSQNFLGQNGNYQMFLQDPTQLQALVGQAPPTGSMYKIVDIAPSETFTFQYTGVQYPASGGDPTLGGDSTYSGGSTSYGSRRK